MSLNRLESTRRLPVVDNFKSQMPHYFAGLVIYVHDSSRPLEEVHYDKEFILTPAVCALASTLYTPAASIYTRLIALCTIDAVSSPSANMTQRHGGELATSPVEPNVTHIVVDPHAVETKADSNAFSAPNFSASNRRAARFTPPNWQLDDFFLIFSAQENPPFIIDTVWLRHCEKARMLVFEDPYVVNGSK
ncbi:uncharacterized protein LOC62_04G006181 [Vanrija pseudolonga]|uniref:BRCT domain-containing protein n=1 Tax=Vanrija pseudolonga TaxID=143232 RepID=A0AAF0YB02_9TREE|nr:hypothetical protein LOC62_04G006181 [Vanrija pseudolonga]